MNKQLTTLSLIILNFISTALLIQPIFAQSLEIEILGGGYKLRGPNKINFASAPASFSGSSTIFDFSSINYTSVIEPIDNLENQGGLIIIDENGGNEFEVTVNATTLSTLNRFGPTAEIPDTNFLIRNYDDENPSFSILDGNSQISDFQLIDPLPNPDSEGYSAFSNGTITLFRGYGKIPSRIKIYPSLKINIPNAQRPGTYTSTLTFTIA